MTALVGRFSCVLIAALVAGTGCQRDGSVPPALGIAANDAPPATTLANAQPAESSLSVKRGQVTLSADARVLRMCGESADLWLLDEAVENLNESYGRLAGEPGTPLYVEVRGERSTTPPGTTVPASYAQVFLLEELLFAASPAEGGGCEAEPAPYRLQARGNEPSWTVEIHTGKLLLKQPGQPADVELPVEETEDAEGSVTYRATGGGHDLVLAVTSLPCTDSMSGEYFAYTAAANLDGRVLQGCARLRE